MFEYMKAIKGEKLRSEGYTLVEVLAVTVILGILAAIAVPSVIWLVERSKEDVCALNRTELDRMYSTHLHLESKDHSTSAFQDYLHDSGVDICPSGGEITFVDGAVKCSIHSDSHGEEEEPDEGGSGVPFL
ncbi:prepilin-type N-terminal cleavage/methylation domain-containing protein [Mesobacillus persicus]|uniref:Prepilin-type N-terminal cleavage/methylation domain-containing protein n=1 Tax=Mesobacillus persicus TaxID=930146 RepID=A0A1H8GZW7_9BACI|nr:prepilin-type N-terminal cleavage/methylation domain-containing protein [Mesobacillus persicus]SEN49037.1 prepilin-type N-terminal cleavage/methylation domain-containing protein [Mesobacillus persicus]